MKEKVCQKLNLLSRKIKNVQISTFFSISHLYCAKAIALLIEFAKTKLPFSSTRHRRHRHCRLMTTTRRPQRLSSDWRIYLYIFTLVLLQQTIAWKGIVQCNQMHFYSADSLDWSERQRWARECAKWKHVFLVTLSRLALNDTDDTISWMELRCLRNILSSFSFASIVKVSKLILDILGNRCSSFS